LRNNNVEIVIPENFNDMKVMQTIISPVYRHMGILIMGEDMHRGSASPIIRIYQLDKVDNKYLIQNELQAFNFLNYASAKSFLQELPKMSALELLITMNNQKATDSRDVGAILHI
jgi:hypothetical protein